MPQEYHSIAYSIFWSDLIVDKTAQKVLNAMKKAGEPMRPGEIAIAAKIEKSEVDKIIKTLKGEGKIHSPKRCYYAPVID
jgi:DNA-binding IclR family transcriptional regulator